jgi:hypothetical protein
VIAQTFAAAPRLDPSGTSWLPLPFWVTGGIMSLSARSLEVARGVALVEAVLAVLLLHRAALWLGATRLGAFLSAAVAAVLPTAARLGASFQPELLTAGLVVLGAAGGAVAEPGRRRMLGATALTAACLCRYEAWPAAVAFSALTVRDHLRKPVTDPVRLVVLPALFAVTAPVLWMLHGAWNHGSPLFFLRRVAAFRQALGESEPLTTALTAYPRALFDEPELLLGAVAIFLGARHAHRLRRTRLPESIEGAALVLKGRFAFILASILLFLVVGRILDGAPTHHAARTLLPLWFGIAVVGVDQALRLPRVAVGLGLVATTGLGIGLRTLAPAEDFAERAAERAIGELARARFAASNATAAGSPPGTPFTMSTSARSAQTPSWSIAAAR